MTMSSLGVSSSRTRSKYYFPFPALALVLERRTAPTPRPRGKQRTTTAKTNRKYLERASPELSAGRRQRVVHIGKIFDSFFFLNHGEQETIDGHWSINSHSRMTDDRNTLGVLSPAST